MFQISGYKCMTYCKDKGTLPSIETWNLDFTMQFALFIQFVN